MSLTLQDVRKIYDGRPAVDGITAEILHVDAGYHAMGSPGRLLDQLQA